MYLPGKEIRRRLRHPSVAVPGDPVSGTLLDSMLILTAIRTFHNSEAQERPSSPLSILGPFNCLVQC